MRNNKYEQLNILTLMAMIMIYTIHYFNYFNKYLNSSIELYLASILRGIALIAVLIFVAITAYSNLYLNKEVNFQKLLLYIILPTLLLTYGFHLFFKESNVYWNTKIGFSSTWYGDMYIGLILSMSLIMFLKNKAKKMMLVVGILLTIFGYYYSIKTGNATAYDLGLLVFVPYIGLALVLNHILFEWDFHNNTIIILLLIIGLLFQIYAYTPLNQYNRIYIISYFSPFSIMYTFGFIKLILNSNLSLKWVRKISRTSYFFYFCSYYVIKYFNNYSLAFTKNNIFLCFVIGIFLSLMLSYVFYYLYDLTLKILKINKHI